MSSRRNAPRFGSIRCSDQIESRTQGMNVCWVDQVIQKYHALLADEEARLGISTSSRSTSVRGHRSSRSRSTQPEIPPPASPTQLNIQLGFDAIRNAITIQNSEMEGTVSLQDWKLFCTQSRAEFSFPSDVSIVYNSELRVHVGDDPRDGSLYWCEMILIDSDHQVVDAIVLNPAWTNRVPISRFLKEQIYALLTGFLFSLGSLSFSWDLKSASKVSLHWRNHRTRNQKSRESIPSFWTRGCLREIQSCEASWTHAWRVPETSIGGLCS